MMQSTNWNGEPVADLTSHRRQFGKLDVVRIRRRPSADQTRLGGHKPDMVAIALAHRLADDRDAVGAGLITALTLTIMAIRVAVTGKTATPPLFDTLVALGYERTLGRIDAARALLEAMSPA